jgi:hypothetical protein
LVKRVLILVSDDFIYSKTQRLCEW